MISSNTIKRIKSYQQKKFRKLDGVFVAETPKVVETLLHSDFTPLQIYALPSWLEQNSGILRTETIEITENELHRISGLVTPNQVLAIFELPHAPSLSSVFQGCNLILDDIRDPGNLGTILRIADWFGMDRIICSPLCCDAFQPKCVQSSMGSIGNVEIVYADLLPLIEKKPEDFPIYGTFLEGDNIYQTTIKENAWFLIGNEAHGISKDLENHVNHRIYIPSFTQKRNQAESLNASMATAILCSEIKRRTL